MAENTNSSCSRYLKRKYDLSEADSIVDNFLKTRKNDSSDDQTTRSSSSREVSLNENMQSTANIINDEENYIAEVNFPNS